MRRGQSKINLDFIQVVDDMDRAVERLDDVKTLKLLLKALINKPKVFRFLKTQGIEEIIAQDLILTTYTKRYSFPVKKE